MMDTDAYCPSCHATAESALAAPPEQGGSAPNGLWMLLPIFGGALGGLAYGAVMAAHGNTGASRGPGLAESWKTIKWILAILLILGGGLFLVIAFFHVNATMEIVSREAKPVTPAELRTKAFVDAPPPWVSYAFDESMPVDEIVTRRRLGHGGDVKAKCILVRVESRWLLATVADGFEGNELVGRIMPIDSPTSQPLIERLRGQQSDPKTILPYEFNAIEGCPSDQQARYTAAAVIGAIGGGAFLLGMLLVFCGRR
jgi:hypothetical protein